MSGYHRVSRECTFTEFDPEIISAVKAHLEKYNLGPILKDPLLCVEVRSEKIAKGLFSGPGPRSTHMGLVVTRYWFLQAIKKDKEKMFARSARFKDITVSDYANNPFFKEFPDFGVEVSGRFTDASESSSSFIGLGQDAAGQKFKDVMIRALLEANQLA